MTKDYVQKTVFALIDLANNAEEQKNVAKYAAKLANALEMNLVLYPQRDGRSTAFNFRKAIKAARKISTMTVRISKLKINTFSMFSSLQNIAEQENAAFIIMGMEKKSILSLGKTIWSTTQSTIIPMILLPHNFDFVPYRAITIAIDAEHKIQKLKTVIPLAKAFRAKINIFTENAKDNDLQYAIYQVSQNAISYLERSGLSYEVIQARKTKNFPKHLCKYSAKNADLLVVEVDPGKIPSVVKQNIETLLTLVNEEPTEPTKTKAEATPVMFTKTKMTGMYGTFR